MIKQFTAVSNSTIYDVCLSTYGSLNYLAKLMDDNDHAGVDLYPTNGQIFLFDSNLVQSPATTNINGGFSVNGGQSAIKYATKE
jgi:hypothetical protein